MCGISGIINTKHPISSIELKKMTDIINHRGPDGEGFVTFNLEKKETITLGGSNTPKSTWFAESPYKPTVNISNENQLFNLGFGHRRLSILDLSPKGHIPMCDSTKRYWITYNGEVYNFLELKEELVQLGYSFISETDTEVILTAYQAWGKNCLDKFVGMFAFAIYDTVSNEIFLARDRFGIKPLYYYTSPNGTFYFGSEIKQFTQTNNWSATLNVQRAYDYLFYSLTDHTEETMFNHVFQLPAGSYFKVNITEYLFQPFKPIDHTQWYILNPKPKVCEYKQACDSFTQLFEKAVELHLRADVAVGSALSGGLDSSSIVCQINKLLSLQEKKHLQKTFSAVAHHEQFSEKKWIDDVISKINVDAHFVYPNPERLKKLTPEILWYMDEPYQSQSAFLGYHVFECAKQNDVKVLLNGQGADEYLSGYEEFKKLRHVKLLLKGNIKVLQTEMKSEGMVGFNFIKYMGVLLAARLLPQKIKQFATTQSKDFKQLSGLLNFQIDTKNLILKHPLHRFKYNTNSTLSIANLQLFHTSLPKYLRWEDRNSMANGVEARVPFLDHRLVEYCLSLPLNFLNRKNSTPKPLLTDSLKYLLPTSIANRKDKKGFITPEEIWIKQEYTEQIREMLAQSINNSQGIIKPEALIYFDEIVANKKPFNYNYWRLILFGMWMNLFNVKIS